MITAKDVAAEERHGKVLILQFASAKISKALFQKLEKAKGYSPRDRYYGPLVRLPVNLKRVGRRRKG